MSFVYNGITYNTDVALGAPVDTLIERVYHINNVNTSIKTVEIYSKDEGSGLKRIHLLGVSSPYNVDVDYVNPGGLTRSKSLQTIKLNSDSDVAAVCNISRIESINLTTKYKNSNTSVVDYRQIVPSISSVSTSVISYCLNTFSNENKLLSRHNKPGFDDLETFIDIWAYGTGVE